MWDLIDCNSKCDAELTDNRAPFWAWALCTELVDIPYMEHCHCGEPDERSEGARRPVAGDNINPEKFPTDGKFDDFAPGLAMKQLFLFARDAGFTEADLRSAVPTLGTQVTFAIMGVIKTQIAVNQPNRR